MGGSSKSHIDFVDMSELHDGKTCMWDVYNEGEFLLGHIKWHNHWRNYCFFPESDTLYDSKCLIKIAMFCKNNRGTRKQTTTKD